MESTNILLEYYDGKWKGNTGWLEPLEDIGVLRVNLHTGTIHVHTCKVNTLVVGDWAVSQENTSAYKITAIQIRRKF